MLNAETDLQLRTLRASVMLQKHYEQVALHLRTQVWDPRNAQVARTKQALCQLRSTLSAVEELLGTTAKATEKGTAPADFQHEATVTLPRRHVETLVEHAEQIDEDPTYHEECCYDCGWHEDPTRPEIPDIDKHKPTCEKRAAILAARAALTP